MKPGELLEHSWRFDEAEEMLLGLPKSAGEVLENIPEPAAAMLIMDLNGRGMRSWPGWTGLSGLLGSKVLGVLLRNSVVVVVVVLIMGKDGMS